MHLDDIRSSCENNSSEEKEKQRLPNNHGLAKHMHHHLLKKIDFFVLTMFHDFLTFGIAIWRIQFVFMDKKKCDVTQWKISSGKNKSSFYRTVCLVKKGISHKGTVLYSMGQSTSDRLVLQCKPFYHNQCIALPVKCCIWSSHVPIPLFFWIQKPW